MARSSKPKEIVVVGSKVKEYHGSQGSELVLHVDDEIVATLSWDVDLVLDDGSPPPGFSHSFFNEFEPHSTVELPNTLLTEEPLGMTVAVNYALPAIGDEVWVSFLASDPAGSSYQVQLHLLDPSGTALDRSQASSPLNLRLEDFTSATLTLSEPGGAPFVTAEVESLHSFVVPEPASIVLVVTMLGTVATSRWRGGVTARWVNRLLNRGRQLAETMTTRWCQTSDQP